MSDYTSFLYAQPSFLEGLARSLDIGNTLTEYNESLSTSQADALALRSDWLAIAADMRTVVSDMAEELRRMYEHEPK